MFALIKGLPPEAAAWRIDSQEWTTRTELLAQLVEIVDFWGRQQAVLGGVKPTHVGEPLRIRRPGDPLVTPARPRERPNTVTDLRQAAAWFARNS